MQPQTKCLQDCVEAALQHLYPLGFDVVHPLNVNAYNQAIQERPELSALPTFGREAPLGLLIGNTRHFWSIFHQAYHANQALQAHPDPVDHYTQLAITDFATTLRCAQRLHFAAEIGPDLVSFGLLASVSGLTHTSPVHLAIHPQYGPWLALRGVIILDEDASALFTPVSPHPCTRCDAPCLEALKTAKNLSATINADAIAKHWRSWAAIRLVCPVGQSAVYSHDQLRYHYTHSRDALK